MLTTIETDSKFSKDSLRVPPLMATKFLPPKRFLNNLRRSSTSSSAISAIPSLDLTQKPVQNPPTATVIKDADPIFSSSILDLNDHQKLFASLSTKKLFHSYCILSMAAMDSVVDLGNWVMNSGLMKNDWVVRDGIMAVVRHSFYEHFVAGEDHLKVKNYVKKVNESGLRAMLDYAVEFGTDKDGCDRNFHGFMNTVEAAKSLPPSSVSFVVVKITAICPLKLLERVSDLLRWQKKDPSFNLSWKENSFPIFSDCSPLYHTQNQPQPLTLEEEQQLLHAQQRLHQLSEKCVEANVPLVVDAEHTSVQPAIDYLTYSSAILYNKHDTPIVYGTIQAYLKDAKERLLLATKAAEKMGIPMGFKLVRGAYMSMETKLASSLGYQSPIHDNIQQTHACYNDCASFLLHSLSNAFHGLILATHNVESGRLAATKARELGIGNVNQRLEFAQLYGMGDAVSYGLRNAGFQVSKYMPFGPVDLVIPYLLRRAEENKGLLSTSSLDRLLIRKELNRRLKAAIF